jgi:hypothetical protein
MGIASVSVRLYHSKTIQGWEVEKQVELLHSAATVIRAQVAREVRSPLPRHKGLTFLEQGTTMTAPPPFVPLAAGFFFIKN